MSAVISVALPVFAIIAAGYFAGFRNILTKEDVGSLNKFVFNFAMPTTLFGLTANADKITGDDLIFASTYGVTALFVLFASYGIGRRVFHLTPETAGTHAFASTLGNAVFLGLPIAMALPGWGENFVILMLVEGVVIISIGAALMSPRGKTGLLNFLVKPITNPLVAAMIAGLSFSYVAPFLGASLPEPVVKFIEILGRAAGPTALFSLGLFLATSKISAIEKISGRIIAITLMKMVCLPILFLGGLFLFGITDPVLIGPAALFALVPTGVGAFVMATQYGKYKSETAAAIAVTTIISVFTVSGVLLIWA